jgi:hypothetical protein
VVPSPYPCTGWGEGELQQRIVSELEEAGEQELITLLNTVADFRQGRPEEVSLYRDALHGLIEEGLVLMAPERVPGNATVEADACRSRQMVIDRFDGLQFVQDELYWVRTPFIYSYVVATESGMARAREVLGERGYEWWYYEDEPQLSE